MDYLEPRHDSEKIDLAFIIDCTGSMGSYIAQVQKHVQYIAETIARTSFDVRLALIEYRDHPPQDKSFITRNHDFTSDVKAMKVWVDQMSADGGGDCPEAMADALLAASRLSYRKQATKMCVLITDAPPHGLEERGDGFPNGCPSGHDPLDVCHTMAQKGIVLYCIGCEPSVDWFRDYLFGLSHITGGQYVPLKKAQTLTKVIVNAAGEEVSLNKLMGHVTDFLYMKLREMQTTKTNLKVDDLVEDLHQKLKITNNQCHTIQVDNQPLQPVTKDGKQYSQMRKMSQAKVFFEKARQNEKVPFACTEGEVVIAADVPISKSQAERLLMKAIAIKKIPVTRGPVTHDEQTGLIVEWDTVPIDLSIV